jgi:hypothetical protein
MTKAVQLIAVIGGVVDDSDKKFSVLRQVAGNEDLMTGHSKTYEPLSEENGIQLAPDNRLVRLTAQHVMNLAHDALARKWDTALTLDTANMGSKGDVTVDGKPLLRDVPVGHLLWLAKELDKLHALVEQVPVLDPARLWQPDDNMTGVSRTAPVKTNRDDTVSYPMTMAPATDKFPAQVQLMKRQEKVGTWTTVNFSGALSVKRKAQLLDRLEVLRNAVKAAREEANTAEVTDRHEAKVIFDWLLAE